jgi:hypothetical protein
MKGKDRRLERVPGYDTMMRYYTDKLIHAAGPALLVTVGHMVYGSSVQW